MLNLIGNGDGLAVVAGGGNEEEVRKAGVDGVELEDAGVFPFLVEAGLSCGLDQNTSFLVCLGCRHSVEIVSNLNRRPSIWAEQAKRCGWASAIESTGANRFKYSCRQELVSNSRSTITGAELLADLLTNLGRADLHIKAGKKVKSGRVALRILEKVRTELHTGPELIDARFRFDGQTRGESNVEIVNQQFVLLARARGDDQGRNKGNLRRPVPLAQPKERVGAHQAEKHGVQWEFCSQTEQRIDGVVGRARRLGSIRERHGEAGLASDGQARQLRAVFKACG